MPRYDAKLIEPKWQHYWESHQTFATPVEPVPEGTEKLYVLDMFPYPSGEGLHVGHPEGYTATDIVCRHARMKGKRVLHPMGWDAFGLPAEQHAIKTKTHPRETTYKNIANFRRQLKMLGFSYDWNREFSTTDPDYFRWTQWIFLQIFNSWYDPEIVWVDSRGVQRTGRGRPISELPIPDRIREQGNEAVRRYQDKHRLAYQTEAPVNWCPGLGTVLANEEVIDGKSERGSHPVVRIPLRQWMLRITAYGERLLSDLEEVNWPESIKTLQRNWIGRSEGAEVDFFIGHEKDFESWKQNRSVGGFPAEPGAEVLRIYTTRPDTLFGATYMVIAPEHPFVERVTSESQRGMVEAYRQKSAGKSDLDRTDLAKDKTGVFTGGYALNPINGARVPIWVADYVLMSYGTGAIMAVPAHDLRDWEFAVKYALPIIPVVQPPEGYEPSREELALRTEKDGVPFSELGTAINSGAYTGLTTSEFKSRITSDLSRTGLGKRAVNFRLRDWLFSRQHFWGEPFPIWHELDQNGKPTGLMRQDLEEGLPVKLPEEFEFKPHGRPDPPLEEAPADWLFCKTADGTPIKRETNSMPQWAGSCWYFLRFIDPKNDQVFIDPALERSWMPVDLYIGGAEHAVLHLLYSRFWHKLLFDRGHVSCSEPFRRLVNQGMILGEAEHTAYRMLDGVFVSAREILEEADPKTSEARFVEKKTGSVVQPTKVTPQEVEKQGNDFVLKSSPGVVVETRAYKMSKSRGNVINPDKVVDTYGADALRLYEMFMGPLEATKPWSMSGVEGIARFLARVWRMVVDEKSDSITLNPDVQEVAPTADQLRILHKTIAAVSADLETLGFNTAISRMMEFTNEISGVSPRPKSILEPFILLLSPFAPHLAEELWQILGHEKTLAYEPWPIHDPALLVQSEVEIPVQVNGKLRGRVKVPAGAEQSVAEDLSRKDPNVCSHLEGKQVVKLIYVADRMLNFVVK